MYKVNVVENGLQATELINNLMNDGFEKDHIYLFAHDEDRSKDLTDATDTGTVGMKEQGLFTQVGNVFKKRGDELRSKMTSLGLTDIEAEKYEQALDQGKVVLVAAKDADHTNDDRTIM
ncbi:general stress protein [Heyndrickxia acidicola]|uniref:General stress protein n=1 Tax=Heyndrickxia acidicola TaxID=209389 RepID=A0ABU6MED8_9BACI|nr:general stress protein [Heyndrickxia acidicola]MED1202865.1 general stress protein [Heyndrickxia acidicola]